MAMLLQQEIENDSPTFGVRHGTKETQPARPRPPPVRLGVRRLLLLLPIARGPLHQQGEMMRQTRRQVGPFAQRLKTGAGGFLIAARQSVEYGRAVGQLR